MENFVEKLEKELSPYHLLKHPFYQSWNSGALNKDIIKDYAAQYYHHVKAFPRYISSAHSICEDIESRRMLLENLNDEENNGKDHPTLWKQFALGAGNSEQDLETNTPDLSISSLIDTFFEKCRSSYPEALASIYSYEYQVPEVARTKIDGLINHYGISEKEALEFFLVHEKADVWHREQCQNLLNKLSKKDQVKALNAAKATAKALWNFLSGIAEKHGVITAAASC
jgi:pyrroloquinoline-quinone synthase